MNITYVVHVDLTPAVDHTAYLDEHEAARIASQCAGFPAGATVRIFLGHARYMALGDAFASLLAHAGTVEIVGSHPDGMRRMSDALTGVDPCSLQAV